MLAQVQLLSVFEKAKDKLSAQILFIVERILQERKPVYENSAHVFLILRGISISLMRTSFSKLLELADGSWFKIVRKAKKF